MQATDRLLSLGSTAASHDLQLEPWHSIFRSMRAGMPYIRIFCCIYCCVYRLEIILPASDNNFALLLVTRLLDQVFMTCMQLQLIPCYCIYWSMLFHISQATSLPAGQLISPNANKAIVKSGMNCGTST